VLPSGTEATSGNFPAISAVLAILTLSGGAALYLPEKLSGLPGLLE
jgi:hypothetical protein